MQHARLSALLLAVALAPSCVAVAAAGVGAAATYGIISYQNNEAVRDFDKRPELVWQAALHALKAQDYELEGTPELGPTEGVVESGGTRVTVERLPGDTTRLRVRVGTFETDQNRRLAKLLVEEIARRMGEH